MKDKFLTSSCYFNKQLKEAYSQRNHYQVLCSYLRDIANFASDNIKALQAEVSGLKTENSRLVECTKETGGSIKLKILKLVELLNEKNNEVIFILSENFHMQKKLDNLMGQFLQK